MLNDQDDTHSFMRKMGDFPVVITSKGVNSITGEVTTATSCNMQMTSFPNDVQTCQIRLSPIPLGIKYEELVVVDDDNLTTILDSDPYYVILNTTSF